jgi:hypothetical protein
MDATNLPLAIDEAFRCLAGLLDRPMPQISALQAHFDEQLRPLQAQDWPEPLASRLRALLTEIQRELRLLRVELMYLQTGRLSSEPLPVQSRQQGQRQQQVAARLERLRQYCRTVLDLDQPVG